MALGVVIKLRSCNTPLTSAIIMGSVQPLLLARVCSEAYVVATRDLNVVHE
jgi:hypothetical protein